MDPLAEVLARIGEYRYPPMRPCFDDKDPTEDDDDEDCIPPDAEVLEEAERIVRTLFDREGVLPTGIDTNGFGLLFLEWKPECLVATCWVAGQWQVVERGATVNSQTAMVANDAAEFMGTKIKNRKLAAPAKTLEQHPE